MTETIEILRFDPSGDLYWKGRKVESDAELREAVIDLHRHFCNYQVVKKLSTSERYTQKTQETVHVIECADWPAPDSGFAKLEAM